MPRVTVTKDWQAVTFSTQSLLQAQGGRLEFLQASSAPDASDRGTVLAPGGTVIAAASTVYIRAEAHDTAALHHQDWTT